MLFTSVDVEALRYLRAKGQTGTRLEKAILSHIALGYQTQLTYQHREGWFNAFLNEGSTGSLWLTAYCLSIFSQAREFTTIDENVLARAAQWMAGHQKPGGEWEPIGWVIHKELEGGLTGNFALTAFVASSLLRYGERPDSAALAGARTYLESHLGDALNNSHSLAMGAYTLALLKSPAAGEAIDRLESMARSDGEGGLYWEPVPMEATSYAVLALHASGRSLPASAAASWIARQKNSRGGFGNTQDTVMALRALVSDAIFSSQSTDVAVQIERGGALVNTARVNAANLDAVQTFSFEPGADLAITVEGKGLISAQLAKLYYMPAELLSSRGGLALKVKYEKTRLAAGDTLRAEAHLLYRGERERTNMALAEIGIPTGFRASRAELQGLVGTQNIQRVDVKGRSVIVYLDYLATGKVAVIPIPLAAAFPAIAAPVSSHAYDYYDPAVEAFDQGANLIIGEKGQEAPFIRGDANQDGEIDMADAIRMLEHLFLGSGPHPCTDTIDVDDDGSLDLSDPIGLLLYLFAGGKLPARPFPKPGVDPTADELPCGVD